MSERKIMSLIFKSFGIYSLLVALPQLFSILMFTSLRNLHVGRDWFSINREWLMSIVAFAAYVLVGYFLLIKSDEYASRLYPSE